MPSVLIGGATIGSIIDTTFASFDFSVFQFLGGIQSDFLTVIAKLFTSMGESIYVIMFAVLGLVLVFFRRTRKVGLSIVFAVIIGTLVTNVILKPMIVRIRPYNTLQGISEYWSWYVGAGMLSESDYCFPSGHTNGAFEIAVALTMCHATSKKKRAHGWGVLFILAAALVGTSRVYLMVHYATDVIAAAIIGIISGLLGYVIGNAINNAVEKKLAASGNSKPVRPLRTAAVTAIALAWALMLCISFIKVTSSGGEDAVRCSYDEEYDCQNEAEVGSSSYPSIDGKYYCKIHWNEIMNK